ncbi:hypothetical protein FXO38_26875 [Capsicum annuum]|uniref:Aminotransferase-like plant mobile domain-containing protein n=1 Tax=Capsicum annuum TaxID=4072 RepID=A0A2G3ANK8_CAPAN|nr:hypothetical protein FXO37_34259 [Capsicum annuum]KAF3630917.1 hypothetical protein FXO38_26875 [Capsicum annuum]PHT95816.1 hypothetical protein T459_03698 [Capsicum annuum]
MTSFKPYLLVAQLFGLSQYIPEAPLWLADYTRHDGRSTVDQGFISEHMHCVDMWFHWQPRVVKVHDNSNLDAYMEWYLQRGRLLFDNPTLSDSRYVVIAPSHEAMRRGLHQLYDKMRCAITSPLEPKPHAVADDDPVGHYEPVHLSSFHPSPFLLGCSSMPEPHNFSTYAVPAWVDEPNRQPYCDMPSQDLTFDPIQQTSPHRSLDPSDKDEVDVVPETDEEDM